MERAEGQRGQREQQIPSERAQGKSRLQCDALAAAEPKGLLVAFGCGRFLLAGKRRMKQACLAWWRPHSPVTPSGVASQSGREGQG